MVATWTWEIILKTQLWLVTKKGARSGTLKTDPQRLLKSSCVHMFILNAIFLRHTLALSHCLSVWRGCGYSPWKLTAGRCWQHLWSYSRKGWVARLCGFLQYWPNHKKHCHPGLQDFENCKDFTVHLYNHFHFHILNSLQLLICLNFSQLSSTYLLFPENF